MQQLAGNENRPRQLGDTGIIVLTKCDQGVCDCNQAQKPKDKTKAKTKVTPQKPRNFGSSAGKKILVEEWSIFLLKSGQN